MAICPKGRIFVKQAVPGVPVAVWRNERALRGAVEMGRMLGLLRPSSVLVLGCTQAYN